MADSRPKISVRIRGAEEDFRPRRAPGKIVIGKFDGQAMSFAGSLLYGGDEWAIVEFDCELVDSEIAALDRLARRVCRRVHKALVADSGPLKK